MKPATKSPYALKAERKVGRNCVRDLMQFSSTLTKTYATVKLTLQTICLWLEDNNVCRGRLARKRIFRIILHGYPVRHEEELTRTLFQNIYCQIMYLLSPSGHPSPFRYVFFIDIIQPMTPPSTEF